MKPPLPRLRTLMLLALPVAVLILLGLEIAGWPFLRHPLERQLTRQLQRPVLLEGKFRAQLIGSIRLQVDTLTVAAPDWESGDSRAAAPPFLRASGARLVLPYRSVIGHLRGDDAPLRIRLLEVDAVDARLARRADGRANWRFARASSDEGTTDFAAPEFVHLIVHKGEFTLRDDYRDLVLRAQARTREGTARDAAGLFVRASGRYRGQDFTAEARSPGLLPLVAPGGQTAAIPLQLSARLLARGQAASELRFRGRARDLLRGEGLDGQFRLSGPSLAATGRFATLTLPSTAPFFMQGRIARQGALWQADISRFEVGQTRLAGHFVYDKAPPRPRLSGELRGRQLLLRDLAPALGAAPAGSNTRAEPAGAKGDKASLPHVLPQREFDIPSLRRMNADVDIQVDRVDLGSAKLLPFEPLQGRLQLNDGVLRLDHLLARTAQGQMEGWLQLDSGGELPLWTGNVRWSGIQLAHWIRLRDRFLHNGDNQSPPAGADFVSGELAGQASFEGRGRSTAAMLGSLDGQLQAWIREGSVSQLLLEALGLDIAESLGLIMTGDRKLPLQCAAVSLKASQGVLRTEAGVVDTPDTLLLLGGQLSLGEETLGLRLEVHPHDRSLLSLRTPLELGGSFSRPRLRPEPGPAGRKVVLATVLGSLLAPLAALLPLVEVGDTAAPGAGCTATLKRLQHVPGTPSAMKRALGGQH